MRVNLKMVFVAVAVAAILVRVAMMNPQYISTPRLVVKFEGKPLSNVALVLPSRSGAPFTLDSEGSITVRELGSGGPILVPLPNGGAAAVGFPQHGTKIVDFQGPVTTTTFVQYFGFVSNQSESFSLTDAQQAELESGSKSMEEILEEIRQSQ